MDPTTQQEHVATLYREGWSVETIARILATPPLSVMAHLRALREQAGVSTNEELRTILKRWGK